MKANGLLLKIPNAQAFQGNPSVPDTPGIKLRSLLIRLNPFRSGAALDAGSIPAARVKDFSDGSNSKYAVRGLRVRHSRAGNDHKRSSWFPRSPSSEQ